MHRVLIGLVALVVGLSSATSSSAFVAKLDAPGHHPKAGKKWRIKVSAHRNGGKPVHASAYYQFVIGGAVVQSCTPLPSAPHRTKCRTGSKAKPHHFFGHYRDAIIWPKKSVGYQVTFRVIVHMRHDGTKRLDYAVKVRG